MPPTPLSALTEDEARTELVGFLAEGKENLPYLDQFLKERGVQPDFQIDGLPEVMRLVWQELSFATRPPNPLELQYPSLYTGKEKELTPDARHGALTLAYYLGETFVQSFPEALRWDIGDRETIFANHPVIAGFRHDMELAVAPVTQNVLVRAATHATPEPFASAVSYWRALI
jgi:hypothetical protein